MDRAGGSELPEKTHIVFEEELDIIDSILEHGNPLYAQAKGETGIDFGVVTHIPVNFRIHHSRAKDLQPP